MTESSLTRPTCLTPALPCHVAGNCEGRWAKRQEERSIRSSEKENLEHLTSTTCALTCLNRRRTRKSVVEAS